MLLRAHCKGALPCPGDCSTGMTSAAHCTAAQFPGLCLHSISPHQKAGSPKSLPACQMSYDHAHQLHDSLLAAPPVAIMSICEGMILGDALTIYMSPSHHLPWVDKPSR